MKRIVIGMICLGLVLAGHVAIADVEPSGAVITIDDVRTAFFDEEGAYLPPLIQDGLVYVPVLSLAESLGLDVTADVNTLAVTVNGVRTAFFGEDGGYLSPLNQNGVLYVPLAAFADSAGVALTVDGDRYALTRGDSAAPEAEPTVQTPIELYGRVPLTLMNYGRYFSLTQECYAPRSYTSSYQLTYILTITATTGYDLVDVTFNVENYGTVRIPATGQATAKYNGQKITRRQYKSEDEFIRAVMSMQTTAALSGLSLPDVRSVSGFIRMSKAEADAINEEEYQSALSRLESLEASVGLEAVAKDFDLLASVGYRDSEEKAKEARVKAWEARSKEAEAKRAEEEKKNEQAYGNALAALEKGEFTKAIKAFESLADAGYKDSAEQLEKAREGKAAHDEAIRLEKLENTYQQGLALEQEGEYKRAIDRYNACGDYRDAKDRIALCNDAIAEGRYQSALALEADGDYEGAIRIYRELGDYSDSPERIALCNDAIAEGRYQSALALEADGDYEGAIHIYRELGDYSDSPERIALCNDAIIEGLYQGALALEADGDYVGAIEQYARVIDYRDSAERSGNCREQHWQSVMTLLANGEYEEARSRFAQLNDDSLESEFAYQTAVAMYAAGDYSSAAEVFDGIRDYRDVPAILAGDVHLAPLEFYSQFSNGKTVLFGRYGKASEPLEWYVLDMQENRCLLLCRHVLPESRKFGMSPVKGWSESSLRKWLNNDFYNEAFNDDEKKQIIKTRLPNMARQLSAKDVTYKDTDDCVFLLSFDECVHYLAGDGANREGKADDITIWFVYPNGSAMAPVITQESLEEGEVDESFFWWLRDMQSVTNPKSNSAYIAWTETDDAGNVSTCVGSRSVELNSCLRPAIWITVDYKPELELTEMVDTSRFAGAPSEAADGNSGEGADGTTEEEAAYATLQKGDKGDAVKALQQKLIDLGYLNGKADGDYGKKTRDAVSAFQRSAGLEQTGVADGRTQAALFAG